MPDIHVEEDTAHAYVNGYDYGSATIDLVKITKDYLVLKIGGHSVFAGLYQARTYSPASYHIFKKLEKGESNGCGWTIYPAEFLVAVDVRSIPVEAVYP
jgi:hypothetical protein